MKCFSNLDFSSVATDKLDICNWNYAIIADCSPPQKKNRICLREEKPWQSVGFWNLNKYCDLSHFNERMSIKVGISNHNTFFFALIATVWQNNTWYESIYKTNVSLDSSIQKNCIHLYSWTLADHYGDQSMDVDTGSE